MPDSAQDVSRYRFLYHAAGAISAELNTDEVLQRLMVLTHEHFRPDAVSVATVQADGTLLFEAASGCSAAMIVGMRLPPGTGVVGWVAEHDRMVWVPEAQQDSRFHFNTDQETGFTTHAIFAMPVRLNNRVVAVVEMINPPGDFDINEATDVLDALAALAAAALLNSGLFAKAQRAERRYQSFFEASADPVAMFDLDGTLLEINHALRETFSLPEAIHAPSITGYLGVNGNFDTLKARALTGETCIWEVVIPETSQTLEARFTFIAGYSEGGAFQWVGHDITERVRLEKARQQFSHMLVHDLRNPLGSILNSVHLVLRAWEDRDLTVPVPQVLNIALRSVSRMEDLINDILETALMENNERVLSITEIDVPRLCRDVIEEMAPSAQRRDQLIALRIADEFPSLHGDLDLLRRVLWNLIGNAVKYTQKGGRIEVSASADAQVCTFQVRDDGPGVSDEDKADIFKLYVQGKSRRAKGAGIGLAFCQLAVEAHGGEIWVDSVLDQGATFTFTLPLKQPEQGVYA